MESLPTSIPSVFPPIDLIERRVLGVLIEKAKTTPENYPLSLNSLVTGCNQKSNREPLMDLDESRVEECIQGLIQKGIMTLVRGGRVERWQHDIYTKWNVSKKDMAVLGELFLRGPQSLGLLRSRASRMEPFDSLEELIVSLNQLAERKLVRWIDAPGSRGARVSHGFHTEKELDNLNSCELMETPDAASREIKGNGSSSDIPLKNLMERINILEEVVKSLQSSVAHLEKRIQELK